MLIASCIAFDVVASDKRDKGKHQRAVRNLPDIDSTPAGKLELDQETNFFSTGGISNTSLDYGTANGWDIGLSLLNAQFFAVPSTTTWNFQPDVLLNLEKHWDWWQGQLIVGSQGGVGYLPQGKRFVDVTYIDYQQTLSNLGMDFDFGWYYANAFMAGMDSVGLHLNLEIPVYDGLRLNGDYLSGYNGLGGGTIKLLYPFGNDWQLGFGVQMPNMYQGDHYIGMLGIYSR